MIGVYWLPYEKGGKQINNLNCKRERGTRWNQVDIVIFLKDEMLRHSLEAVYLAHSQRGKGIFSTQKTSETNYCCGK